MLLLQQKWRKKSQNSILRAVEENTRAERLLHDGARRNVKLKPQNEAAPPDFPHRRGTLAKRRQLFPQILPDAGYILQQLLFFQDFQIFESHAAGQGTATKSSPMLSDGNRRREFFFCQECPQR